MPKELVIIHGGALGDLVLTLQLARRLPGVGAGSTLHVISRIDPGDLSRCRPSVRRISPEGLGLHRLHAESDDAPPERLHELLSGGGVLNALAGPDSLLHRRVLALGPRTLYSIDPRPQPGLKTHITTQWQRVLEGQGVLFPKRIYQRRDTAALVVPDDLRQHPRAPLRDAVLIHPGSGGRTKCWPLRCFLDVGRRLREIGSAVAFIVGPVEVECWSATELDAIRAKFPLMVAPEPDDLLALLAGARMLISNDAGPAHLASLLGTPTVTLFGPTPACVWRPLGAQARAIQGDPEAQPADWGVDPRRVVGLCTCGARVGST